MNSEDFAELIREARADVQVEVGRRGVAPDERAAIDGLIAAMRRRAGFETDEQVGSDDQPLFESLLGAALRSFADGSGVFTVQCRIRSAKPVRPDMCLRIGEAFFGTTVECDAGNEDRFQTGTTLDLRSLQPSHHGLPVDFPEPAALASTLRRLAEHPAPANLSRGGLLLGRARSRGRDVEIRLSSAVRSRHVFIVGASGTGKSTLMRTMISGDLAAGRGFCLVDPHGDLYQEVLDAVPPRRIGDVRVVDASDEHLAAGINMLEISSGPDRARQAMFVTNELVDIIDRLYDLNRFGGPIFGQYFRNALLLLMLSSPDPSLLDLPLVFESSDFRVGMLNRCPDPAVVGFWRNQADHVRGENSLSNMGPYITSKLDRICSNALLRPIFGQGRSSINFRQVMDSGGILLVNLAKGIAGSLDARLLGMIVLAKLYAAALGRARVPLLDRRPFQIYVDEFQELAANASTGMLAESRKFGLGLTLANQTLSQLVDKDGSTRLLDEVLGNVATLLAFRVGPADAGRLEAYTGPQIVKTDLVRLPDRHAATRLHVHGAPSEPFVFQVHRTTGRTGSASEILRRRSDYSMSPTFVEDYIRMHRKDVGG